MSSLRSLCSYEPCIRSLENCCRRLTPPQLSLQNIRWQNLGLHPWLAMGFGRFVHAVVGVTRSIYNGPLEETRGCWPLIFSFESDPTMRASALIAACRRSIKPPIKRAQRQQEASRRYSRVGEQEAFSQPPAALSKSLSLSARIT